MKLLRVHMVDVDLMDLASLVKRLPVQLYARVLMEEAEWDVLSVLPLCPLALHRKEVFPATPEVFVMGIHG